MTAYASRPSVLLVFLAAAVFLSMTVWLMVPLLEWYLKHGEPNRWHHKRSADAYLNVFRRGLASAQGLLRLKTATNTQTDWVRAGRAHARLGLAASKLGLFMHPYSQVLQESPEMGHLQREFNHLLGVTGEGKMQMAVLLGRGPAPYDAYRRRLGSLIRGGRSARWHVNTAAQWRSKRSRPHQALPLTAAA